jgi:hypothetical protein
VPVWVRHDLADTVAKLRANLLRFVVTPDVAPSACDVRRVGSKRCAEGLWPYRPALPPHRAWRKQVMCRETAQREELTT